MILPLLFVPLQKILSNNKEIVKILLTRQKKSRTFAAITQNQIEYGKNHFN